ncbi:glycosyltransferase family 2 protein [Candidatus Micrarchaeota archaeon]|nr:glycosyltransferase family 2 protein [Candidatus Micrarchaeota archaeon]MBU1681472.1 glycosyltransferase family 2 protein [Candidatus Micrarchaeota archaeon]
MISVILPAHNEASTILQSTKRLTKFLDTLNHKYEIIIAEDGSTDNTVNIARSLTSEKLKVLSSKQKLGRGLALSNSIRFAKGKIVVYMDVDLATNLPHLKTMIQEIEQGADIVTGSRLMKKSQVSNRSTTRNFFSNGYNLLLRILFGSRLLDHQCGFKAFKKSSILPLLPEISDPHWFWDTELLILAQRKNLKIIEIPVKWTDKKNSKVNLLSDIPYMGLAMLKLRFK